jgi:hypothetical protein
MHANQLTDLDLHHWKNWFCNVGFDSIYVDEQGKTWAGMCQNQYLGNIYGEVNLLDEPGKCQFESCTNCTTDLMSYKVPTKDQK